MRRLLLATLVLLPATAQAQMTPLFASDIRAATDTLWGFSNNDQSFFTDAWTVTRVTGPAGGNTDDAIRIVGIATDRDEQDGSHLYTSMPEATVAQGATRYFRMRIKVNSPIRWPSNVSGTNANSSGGKVALLGNGCGLSGDRVIFTIFDPGDSNRDGPVALRIDKGVSTEADIDTFLTPDQWESFQFRMIGGTTAVSTDASYAVWKNNDTVGSPTATATGFAWNNTGLGQTSTGGAGCQLQWGVDAFNHLADDTFADANFSIEIADLEYDDEFDPNWYSGGGATYSRFRFRSSVEPTPWGLVAWTDRRRRGVMA